MQNIPSMIATFLDKDVAEVKTKIKDMSIRDLVELLRSVSENDKELAFKIYSGSAV